MARGTYGVFVDWNDNGNFTGAEDDISADVWTIEWARGRDFASQLVGKSIGAKLTVVLNNTSGKYSSFNTSSPITGLIVPKRKVRITWGIGSFPFTFPFLFPGATAWTGFLETVEADPKVGGINTAVLRAIGPLAIINMQEDIARTEMLTSKRTDEAITEILDAAGWPAADRDLDTGLTTITRFWLDGIKPLEALRAAEETEAGFLWETREGQIAFGNRHARFIDTNSTTVQATFSDATGAALSYVNPLTQQDPLGSIYNHFEVELNVYTVAGVTVLWTHPETGASSPYLEPGASRTFIATYPVQGSPVAHVAVDAWTTLASTTDYTANSQSGGGGTDMVTDVGVALVKKSERIEITLTNNHATLGMFITKLQARGTAVSIGDPTIILEKNATSITSYGARPSPIKPVWLPSSGEAQSYVLYNLAAFKDPNPVISLTILGTTDTAHLIQIMSRDIGDRITLVAANSMGLGINEDFFIESEHHRIDRNSVHIVTYELSPISGSFGDYFVVGTSKVGIGTRAAY